MRGRFLLQLLLLFAFVKWFSHQNVYGILRVKNQNNISKEEGRKWKNQISLKGEILKITSKYGETFIVKFGTSKTPNAFSHTTFDNVLTFFYHLLFVP